MGESQEEFAYNCGIHRTYMGEVERGETNATVDKVRIIAKGVGILLADLFAQAVERAET